MVTVAGAVLAAIIGALVSQRVAQNIAPDTLTVRRLPAVGDGLLVGAAVIVAAFHAPSVAAATAGIAALIAAQIATHVDRVYRVIPNRLTYRMPAVLLVVTAASGLYEKAIPPHLLLALGLGVGAPLLLFSLSAVYRRYTGLDGFGMGDIKLAVSLTYAVALWGPTFVAVYAYATFLTAALVSSVLLVTGRATRQSRVAFAPYFLAGMVIGIIIYPLVSG
jgi:leader peptidase (prepilin peptidase)/N-methyltransferase